MKNGVEKGWKLKMFLNMQKLLICRLAATTTIPEWPQAAAIVSEVNDVRRVVQYHKMRERVQKGRKV